MKRLNDWLRDRSPQPEVTGSFNLRKKEAETPSIIASSAWAATGGRHSTGRSR